MQTCKIRITPLNSQRPGHLHSSRFLDHFIQKQDQIQANCQDHIKLISGLAETWISQENGRPLTNKPRKNELKCTPRVEAILGRKI